MGMGTLSYDETLTLEEARERLGEAQQEFDEVRRKYTTGFRKYVSWMSKEDQRRITDCVDVLLPLCMQRAVQNEIVNTNNPGETVRQRAGELTKKVFDMLASFRNTGTRRIGYSEPIWQK